MSLCDVIDMSYVPLIQHNEGVSSFPVVHSIILFLLLQHMGPGNQGGGGSWPGKMEENAGGGEGRRVHRREGPDQEEHWVEYHCRGVQRAQITSGTARRITLPLDTFWQIMKLSYYL